MNITLDEMGEIEREALLEEYVKNPFVRTPISAFGLPSYICKSTTIILPERVNNWKQRLKNDNS